MFSNVPYVFFQPAVFEGPVTVVNRRKLRELPYHLQVAGSLDELNHMCLFNFEVGCGEGDTLIISSPIILVLFSPPP